MQTETHPWQYFHPEDAETMIIGTFPPTKRNWSYDFFYPNKNNYFWKIMACIAKHELQYFSGEPAVEERKRLLNQLKIGVSDMGKTIQRIADNSSDGSLKIIEYMDIFKILEENPSIRKIIFTSSSGKSSAIYWFKDYLETKNIQYNIPKGKRPLRNYININNKEIEIVLLYSPSPRVTIPFDNLVELYKNEIKMK